MKLYLEKRGCDFFESDEDARQHSDLENYRLFLEFIDKDGKRVCGDVSRGDIRSTETSGKKPVILSHNGLYTDFQYENHTGCYCYRPGKGYYYSPGIEYTKDSVLQLINSMSAVAYDDIEIVSSLPDAAHEYPEDVLELERNYLADEHAAMFHEEKQKINDNFVRWYNGPQWNYHKMTPTEYKECTLLAFRLMSEKVGVVEEKPDGPTPAYSVVRRMCKHFFEVQKVIDPYADDIFLLLLEKYAPYYVRQYMPEMTLEEFSSKIVKMHC